MQYCRTISKLLVLILISTLLSACMLKQGGGSGFNLFPTRSIAEDNAPQIPAHLVMDVGIEEFEENYTLKEAKEYKVFPEVRKAEAKYFPLRLKQAIDKTDFWGNVWLVPQSAVTDIKVRGKIIKSTGEYLELEIQAMDATGKVLLNRKYNEKASEYDYTAGRKPFDIMFTTIAKDLQKVYNGVDLAKIEQVKDTAELRFANWIAPEAFSQYVDKANNHKAISMPSKSDPIYQQTIRLRELDALFFDKLQDYYDEFYNKAEKQHTQWAHESFLEIEARNKERRDAMVTGIISGLVTALGVAVAASGSKHGNSNTATAGAVVAGAGAVGIAKAVQKYRKSKIHDDALKELGASSESALRPHTLDVEGKTIQLKGSIDQQYLRWHEVLQEQYRESVEL